MKKCLLIVDVQKGFINKSTNHIPNLVEQLQKDYSYVYTTRFFNKTGSFYRTLINWDRLEKNSEELELAFKPLKKTKIIDKSIYTWVDKNFLDDLKKNNINEVHVCGIDTDACVTKCVIDLFEQNIKPIVLAKYCASYGGVEFHECTLKILPRLIGEKQIIL